MHIIGTSALYRYQNYWMILFITLVIITNILFIPPFGMAGAALASLVSTFTITIIKFVFLKWKFNFQPYSVSILIITFIAGGTLGLNYLLPTMAFWPDLIIRSVMIGVVFSVAIYLTRVSGEVNEIANQLLRIIKPFR